MELIAQQPKVFLYALLGGVMPAILWLWFWLREEDELNPEPRGLIILSFILGGISVVLAIGLEKFSLKFINDKNLQILVWAAIEEIIKLACVIMIIRSSDAIDEPIDYPMYFIAVALGFAAIENALFLVHPISTEGTLVGAITGNLRFLGSTLLHSISSSMIGIGLGLSYYRGWFYKKTYLVFGLITAIVLHTLFNFFIMKGSGENFLRVFGFIWIVAIINILIFEKLKRMGHTKTLTN